MQENNKHFNQYTNQFLADFAIMKMKLRFVGTKKKKAKSKKQKIIIMIFLGMFIKQLYIVPTKLTTKNNKLNLQLLNNHKPFRP